MSGLLPLRVRTKHCQKWPLLKVDRRLQLKMATQRRSSYFSSQLSLPHSNQNATTLCVIYCFCKVNWYSTTLIIQTFDHPDKFSVCPQCFAFPDNAFRIKALYYISLRTNTNERIHNREHNNLRNRQLLMTLSVTLILMYSKYGNRVWSCTVEVN